MTYKLNLVERFLEVNKKDRIFGLDLIRTIAIVLVLISHGDFILKKYFTNYPGAWISGSDGVNVFFVLSGFLIGSILLKEFKTRQGHLNLISFWKRRWYRTFPNYFLVLILNILIYILFFKNYSLILVLGKYFVFSQNLMYPMQKSFFPESWSITVEEWFYLFLPVICSILLFITKNYGRSFFYTTVILIFFSLSYKTYKSFQFVPGYDNYIYYFTNVVIARFDTLAVGLLGAYLSFFFPNIFYSNQFIKLILGLLLILFSLMLPINQLYLISNSFVFSIGVLFCFPLCVTLKNYPKFIGNFVLYVSVISYSLYLFHFSIVLWFLVGVKEYISIFDMLLNYSLYIICSFIISTFIYKYFELFFLKRR